MRKLISILGVGINNLSLLEAARLISDEARDRRKLTRIMFVNTECLNVAYGNQNYKRLLHEADYVFGDGAGIRYACKFTRQKILDNVNGTDLYPLLCECAALNNQSIFLLGGKPGIARAAALRTQRRYPGLKIAGFHDGYFNKAEAPEIVKSINATGADILLVAMGTPGQESWIDEYQQSLNAGVAIGVGGLLDFVARKINRAPNWVRQLGFEWIIRLINEPLRLLRRYVVGNPLFLFRVLRAGRSVATSPERVQGESDFRLRGSTFDPWQDFEILDEVENKYLRTNTSIAQRRFTHVCLTRAYHVAKRMIDVAVSSLGLVCLSPLFLCTALLIIACDPGPVFFIQTRVGRFGQRFKMVKFRSMKVNADLMKHDLLEKNESSAGVLFKMKSDPRVTWVGKYIRRYSLDELPQLLNVLRGDMTLVGPRPPLPGEVEQYSIADRRRLEVKPGITCIWQVSGRSDIDFSGQVKLDVEYIENQSLAQDVRLLLKTLPAVVLAKGAY